MLRTYSMVALAASMLLLSGCGASEPEQLVREERQKVISVLELNEEHQQTTLSVAGFVEGRNESALSFGTSGTITRVNVEKGTRVSEGQLLAEVESVDLYARAEQAASAMVDLAQDNKVQRATGESVENIERQRIRVAEAERDLELAAADLERFEVLFESGALSKKDFEDQQSRYVRAESALERERITLDGMLKGDPQLLASVESSVLSSYNTLAQAQRNVNAAQIRAPFSGVVAEVSKKVGEQASPGTAIIHLVDLAEVKVVLQVDRDRIDYFRKGQQVEVQGERGAVSKGTIAFVSPTLDTRSGKYTVEVRVSNQDGQWRSGMVARVSLPHRSSGYWLPLSAVGLGSEGRYVMAVEEGKTVRRSVTVGLLIDDRIEVLSGVDKDDWIITAGIAFLTEGEEVEPRFVD
ncbi:efflux RND transporter periplasmic adaptor subunit [Heliorestis convoluta]|uniref:RND transporter, hydrophobe/amphiphile efflux-1 (HAE1) family, MFP subunit MdtA n=1 Tax=Heliorestis convoluta TaxID=356322 RepID=A0A5Q2MZN8_9FIRM|nr:efflux RND transporter periplasmic adaptor subunit [Heliorestis convoluta]QGG48454.1 RND transporter, hydrophobe/amphiphile efflux-1 (HAE1) family, MFP subunit MdtA [Heliorestis convoluta]